MHRRRFRRVSHGPVQLLRRGERVGSPVSRFLQVEQRAQRFVPAHLRDGPLDVVAMPLRPIGDRALALDVGSPFEIAEPEREASALWIARHAPHVQHRFETVERLHVVVEREVDQLTAAIPVELPVVDRAQVQFIEDPLEQRLVRHRRGNRDERDEVGRCGAPARGGERQQAPPPQLLAEEAIVVEVAVGHRHRPEFPEHAFGAGVRAAKNREVAGELVERLGHRVEERAVVQQRFDRGDHAAPVRRAQLVPVKKSAAHERARGRRPVRVEPRDLLLRRMPRLESGRGIRIERLLDDLLECRFVGRIARRLRIEEEQGEARRHRGREHAGEDPFTHR